MLAKPKLPLYFAGVDIESKSTALNAYMLSFGVVKINMKKFKLHETCNAELDPNDPKAVELLDESKSTVEWWNKAGTDDPWAPSLLAKQRAWGGSIPYIDGLKLLHRTLNSMNKENTVFTSRGPEFDMRIIEQVMYAFGFDWRLRFSNFDSDRTYERVANAMGLPKLADGAKVLGETFVKHDAVCDAAYEGFNGAIVLWMSVLLVLVGKEKALEELDRMHQGTFDPEPYLDKVEFV